MKKDQIFHPKIRKRYLKNLVPNLPGRKYNWSGFVNSEKVADAMNDVIKLRSEVNKRVCFTIEFKK